MTHRPSNNGPMDAAALQARFDVGCALVEEAGAVALRHFRRLASLTVRTKGLQDVVSEADVQVEHFIRERLAARFPEDDFLGEETGRGELAGAPGIWVVDPIDGTQPFLSGLSSWCVSIAFVAHGALEMGFVASPASGETFIGARGRPATLNGAPIHVSASGSLDHGVVGIGYSPRVGPDNFLPVFERLLRRGGTFYRNGSGALMLCHVACGRLIGYIEQQINSWDCLGALAVIEAAGGQSNDFLANDGLWRGGRLVAGPPSLLPELESLFDQPLAPTGTPQ